MAVEEWRKIVSSPRLIEFERKDKPNESIMIIKSITYGHFLVAVPRKSIIKIEDKDKALSYAESYMKVH